LEKVSLYSLGIICKNEHCIIQKVKFNFFSNKIYGHTTISIIICVENMSKRNENTMFYLLAENLKLVQYYFKNEIHITAHY